MAQSSTTAKRKTKKIKPFFYFEELKASDKIAIAFYTIFTAAVIMTCDLGSFEAKKEILIMYIIVSQLFLYFFLYVSLRNLTSYLVWFSFGILHLVMCFFLKGNPKLQMYRGDPSTGLRNTIVLLLLFQLLRFISFKLQRREFVAPAKGGGQDLIENKIISLTDYVILVIYMASWFGLTILSFSNLDN